MVTVTDGSGLLAQGEDVLAALGTHAIIPAGRPSQAGTKPAGRQRMSKRLRGATYLAALAVVLLSACSGARVSSPTRSPALTATTITATTPSFFSTATQVPATIAAFPTGVAGGSSDVTSNIRSTHRILGGER
jgi:hypothetical protein